MKENKKELLWHQKQQQKPDICAPVHLDLPNLSPNITPAAPAPAEGAGSSPVPRPSFSPPGTDKSPGYSIRSMFSSRSSYLM